MDSARQGNGSSSWTVREKRGGPRITVKRKNETKKYGVLVAFTLIVFSVFSPSSDGEGKLANTLWRIRHRYKHNGVFNSLRLDFAE